MKILIIGNGGREHALLWKLRRDAPDAELYITRGNGGTHELATHLSIDPGDIPGIASWADGKGLDLVVVGPEAPLAEGIVDVLSKRGIPVFGPTAAAAEIEASKRFAKELMRRAGVPTADYATFSDYDAAAGYIRERGAPIVVKASGLAAGKGALVCDTVDEALSAARAMLRRSEFGEAGAEIVVEERMQGEELSLFCLSDGRDTVPLLPAQDHKRIGEGDTGPNTGGMGAYAPTTIADRSLIERVLNRIVRPTLDALREDGRTYRGLLYAGLMLTRDGPKVVEFNARFGDPETQPLMLLLESSLLDPLRVIAAGGAIGGTRLEWKPGAAVATVLASAGYPGRYRKGQPIEIPADLGEDVVLFHAGTRRTDDGLITAGGRVLTATATGPDVARAAARSREAARRIAFEGKQFRGDIGWRELDRLAARGTS